MFLTLIPLPQKRNKAVTRLLTMLRMRLHPVSDSSSLSSLALILKIQPPAYGSLLTSSGESLSASFTATISPLTGA